MGAKTHGNNEHPVLGKYSKDCLWPIVVGWVRLVKGKNESISITPKAVATLLSLIQGPLSGLCRLQHGFAWLEKNIL